jgi:hypothetical protein
MGSVGKVAFVVILALGAVTGIVAYYLFALVMPHPGVVESLYRTDLAPATGTKENKPVIIDESKFHNKVAITILKGASTQGNPSYDPNAAKVSTDALVTWTRFYDINGNNVGGLQQVPISPATLKSFQSGVFNIKAPKSALSGTPSFVRLEYVIK